MRSVRVALAVIVAALAVVGGSTPLLLATAGRSVFDDVAVALVIATYAVVGVVIELARPGHAIGRVMLAGAGTWGCGEALIAVALREDPSGTAMALAGVVGTAGRGLGWLLLIIELPLLFPDGRPRRYAARLALVGITLFVAGSLLAPEPLDERLAHVDNPIGLSIGWGTVADLMAVAALVLAFVCLLLAVAALVGRWRQGDPIERQQVLIFAMAFALPLLVLPLVATPWVDPWMFAVVTLPVPVAVAVALLQRRLYDVRLAANRTLTYGALSVALAVLYAAAVGGVGAMLARRGAVWLPWVGAGVVAMAFAPLRDSLQRGANRLIHGRWSAPAEVLADTGHRLADASDGPALLRSLTGELVNGLGLNHAAIIDRSGRALARSGTEGEETGQLVLTAYGLTVGALQWSGGPLREHDERLLGDVARQMGGVVHTASLVEALREAQERLVGAREQERRRVRRDLHDGLGPALAGLGFQVDTIANLVHEGRPVEDRLDHLQAGLRGTVAEVRRIVEGLRPPALDDLGLFGAVAELGHDLVGGAGLDLSLDLPETHPVLPAAVEVVAYRVAQEALTNVVRHAAATSCRVSATLSDNVLALDVSDDGQPRSEWSGVVSSNGVGLRSMSERANEIGGRVDVNVLAHGTHVALWLPLRAGVAP